jgi:TonB family protein
VTYPDLARAADVEADVPLELVVDEVGAVIDAHVLRPAGLGLDAAALAAVRRYRFTPAERAGRPVRVRMRWSVEFRLH